jgi:hypothetical protein
MGRAKSVISKKCIVVVSYKPKMIFLLIIGVVEEETRAK